MNRKRLVVVGLAAVAVAALLFLLFLLLRKKDAPDGAQGKAGGAAADAGAGPAKPPPRPEPPTGEASGPPPGVQLAYDDDPAGTIRLEGQVVDADEHGVGGALVALSSNPPRQVKTEADGGFAFEQLLAREYTLMARSEDATGGPVTVRVNTRTEPVILRLRPAGTLEVTVQTAATRKAIAGADVTLEGLLDQTAVTDADGKAVLRGVASGWTLVTVRGRGYAPAREILTLAAKPGAPDQQTILLSPGAAVSGRVVDESGKPIAGARVAPTSSSALWAATTREDAVTTDAKGAWSMPALGAGTFHFDATHEKYAPGSSPSVLLDGGTPVKDIVITMRPGAHVAGRVVDRGGAAVPFAAVRVAPKGSSAQLGGGSEVTRQVYCDDKGAFDIDGLPRQMVRLMALHESAASGIMELDLAAKPELTGVTITLDVDGTISGLVVDADGKAVPEAQVTATPELGAGDEQELTRWALRGFASDVADAGGRFTLTGLAAGRYRLRGGRPGADDLSSGTFWQRPGLVVEVGAKDVRLTLEADGTVTGKVLFADGSAPATFFVATSSYGTATSFSGAGGDFRLEHVPPGPRFLTISGPGFTRQTTDELAVKAGGETDAGTITVEKGRAIRGRVVGADGQPVARAKVLAGARLVGDGASLGAPGVAAALGLKESETDDEGTFVLAGVGVRANLIVADHPTLGRSAVTPVPPGQDDVVLTLTLAALGALEGKVTAKGAPVDGAYLIAQPQSAARGQFVVTAGKDGSYRFDKLAPDRYLVSAARSGGVMGGDSKSASIVVKAEQTARLDIDLPVTDLKLTVKVEYATGGGPDNAIVFLSTASIAPANLEELENAIVGRGPGGVHQGIIMKGAPEASITFDNLTPGGHTICATPLMGDLTDPATSERLQKDPDTLPVYCKPFTLAASPAAQRYTLIVPVPAPAPAAPAP